MIILDLIVRHTEKRPGLFVLEESALDGLPADTAEEAGRVVGLASHSEEFSSERLVTATTPCQVDLPVLLTVVLTIDLVISPCHQRSIFFQEKFLRGPKS